MKWRQIGLIIAVSAVSAVSSVWLYEKFSSRDLVASQANGSSLPANYAGFFDNVTTAEPVDFTKAANAAVPAVVHIKTKTAAKRSNNQLPRRNGGSVEDWFDQFFNFDPQTQREQRASGSGVIISDDGYIITNNHVISDGGTGVAEEITVTMNNKKVHKARVIGRDPSSDIAVLKIDGKGFPFLLYGNSDNVKLGQWVLAIGYPLTLETTVTAGIVSAKGRKIGINERQSQTPIESFIQTDAAVNQGNSGGPVFNRNGEVVGILTGKQTSAEGAVFALHSKYIYNALNSIRRDSSYQKIKMPTATIMKGMDRTQQVKKLTDFVYMVKVD
jgi:S1-C subfamily serine protease